MRGTGIAGRPEPARLEINQPVAMSGRDLDGAITAAVGDDDDLIAGIFLGGERLQGRGEEFLLVVGGNHNGDRRQAGVAVPG